MFYRTLEEQQKTSLNSEVAKSIGFIDQDSTLPNEPNCFSNISITNSSNIKIIEDQDEVHMDLSKPFQDQVPMDLSKPFQDADGKNQKGSLEDPF